MNEILRAILFLPEQRSTIARDIDALHYFVIGSTFGGALLVTVVGGVFLFRYRRGARPAGKMRSARQVRRVEAVVLAGIFALFVLFWAIGATQYMRLRVAPENTMEVYVTGKQWMWRMMYPGGAVLHDLVVPTGKPIKLILTSRDVIHSFYVPEFRIKQDAVPGRYTTAWFEATAEGSYPILCTEYCGTGHSTMRATVVALKPADFELWLQGASALSNVYAQAAPAPAGALGQALGGQIALSRRGQAVAAEQGCLRCHTLDGTPHIGPTWKGMYGSIVPLERGQETVADGAYITQSIMDPMAKIHRGFQPVMPSYQGRLGPTDVAAILELIRSISQVPGDMPPPTPGKAP